MTRLEKSTDAADQVSISGLFEGQRPGLEFDPGLELDQIFGRWAAAEVKLGGARATVGMESLRQVIDQIDTESMGEPSFRLVVTSTGPVFTADDGTVTAPLSELAP